LRADAARRPLRPTAKQYATQQFTQAEAFLTWLHERAIAPNRVAQADIDTWYATHRVHQRQLVRGFLTWAIQQGHLPRRLVVPRVAFQIGAALTQQQRLDLLRRYAADQDVPPHLRAAACVLLLYGQPLSRIHRLTRHDLIDSGTELAIRLGDPPTPVPQPFADLLRHLAATARETPSGWLFPGKYIDQPIAYTTIGRHLRALGFPLIGARVAALRQLVQEIPAPVVADALGFHQTSTARQVVNAGTVWSRYAASTRTPARTDAAAPTDYVRRVQDPHRTSVSALQEVDVCQETSTMRSG
jgi:integrase